MSIFDKELIAPVTAAQMVEAYNHACTVAQSAFTEIGEAEQRLVSTFGRDYGSWSLVGDTRRHKFNASWNADNPQDYIDALLVALRRQAWEKIINVTGVKKMMSIKRIEEMEDQLEADELPEITVENIIGILTTLADNAQEIQTEIVKSAFKVLMPSPWGKLKTEERTREYGIGEKVILRGVLAMRFKGGMEIHYYNRERIAEIDKAFHVLDGKGVPDGYITPLVDAVNQEPDSGETDYFSFKKYKNGNLHLTFTRKDLLNKFNKICGSTTLHK